MYIYVLIQQIFSSTLGNAEL